MGTTQYDPQHPERGWHEVKPMKAPRHWPWLQALVDKLYNVKRRKIILLKSRRPR